MDQAKSKPKKSNSNLVLIISLIVILILFILLIVFIVLYARKGRKLNPCSTSPPPSPDGQKQIDKFNQLTSKSSQEYWGINGGQYFVMFFTDSNNTTSGQYSVYVDSGKSMLVGDFTINNSNNVTLTSPNLSITGDTSNQLTNNTTAYTFTIQDDMIAVLEQQNATFLSDSPFLLTAYIPNK